MNDPHSPSTELLIVYVFIYVLLPFILIISFLLTLFKPKWLPIKINIKSQNIILFGTFAYIVILKISGLLLQYVSRFEKVITVETKSNFASAGSKKNSMRNIVMDNKGKVYSFSDSLIFWSFKTTNNYIKIQEGESYKVKGFGIRLPFFSMYPSIYAVDKV